MLTFTRSIIRFITYRAYTRFISQSYMCRFNWQLEVRLAARQVFWHYCRLEYPQKSQRNWHSLISHREMTTNKCLSSHFSCAAGSWPISNSDFRSLQFGILVYNLYILDLKKCNTETTLFWFGCSRSRSAVIFSLGG